MDPFASNRAHRLVTLVLTTQLDFDLMFALT
jgi:hypothetical protein